MTHSLTARVAAGLVAVATLGVAPHPGSIPAASSAGQDTVPSASALRWHACATAPAPYECTEVMVPAHHADPQGDTRSIAVIRLPASGPGPHIGTLVVNPGGPGTSGLTYLPAAVPLLFARLTPHFDLVSIDPRGVGATRPVRCVDDAQRDAALARADVFPDRSDVPTLVADAQAIATGCHARHGTELGELTTATAARDLDRIRAALGLDQISYLGFSYGTYLGATYASLFPRRLRALALDGAVDPAQTARDPLAKDAEQAAGFENGLGRFLHHCDTAPGECPFAGDARRRFHELLARTSQEPLPAPTGDPTRPVTDHTLVTAVQAALYARQSWPFLGAALSLAESGDGSLLQLASDQFAGRDETGAYAQWTDAFTAITAVDRDYPSSIPRFAAAAAAARRRAPTFGALNVWSSLPAGLWATGPDEDFEGPFTWRSAGAPALVVGTTHDTATPYRGARAMADQLDDAVLLTMDGDGHTAYGRGSHCIDGAVDAYLLHLSVPPSGTVCDQDLAESPEPVVGLHEIVIASAGGRT